MQIIAHRGASAEYPENSLKAFESALQIGVDALETDLLITKDGRLVLRHDDLICFGDKWFSVSELTLDELLSMDVGKGERMMTLESFLDRFMKTCPLILDLKTFGLAAPLTEMLRRRHAGPEIHVTSFLHAEIQAVGATCPEVNRSIVLAALPIRFEEMFEDTGTREVSLFRGYLSQIAAKALVDHDITVRAYPVNLPDEAERFASWGVHGIFTDNPAAMQALRK